MPQMSAAGRAMSSNGSTTTAQLFEEHAAIDVIELAGEDRWQRLGRTFVRRRV